MSSIDVTNQRYLRSQTNRISIALTKKERLWRFAKSFLVSTFILIWWLFLVWGCSGSFARTVCGIGGVTDAFNTCCIFLNPLLLRMIADGPRWVELPDPKVDLNHWMDLVGYYLLLSGIFLGGFPIFFTIAGVYFYIESGYRKRTNQAALLEIGR